jgi:hypothetical protein
VVLTQPPVTYVVAAICLALAGLMFPFALVPFAVTLPGTAIAFFALGITFRDGVLIAVGLAFAAGAGGAGGLAGRVIAGSKLSSPAKRYPS